jgi:alginate O-acetyltransferase complex protein AlgI
MTANCTVSSEQLQRSAASVATAPADSTKIEIMSLSNPFYPIFLAAMFLVFIVVRRGTARQVMLLISSYIFYYYLSGRFILLLVLVTALTYAGAIAIHRCRNARIKELTFSVLIILLLLPLFTFKYLDFVIGLTSDLLSLGSSAPPLLGLALPIGISFFTFASLGYLIDVFLDVVEPEYDFRRVALFVAFFPTVTAGPIERAGTLLPQLDLKSALEPAGALSALRMIFVGLALKVLFADTLIEPANVVLDAPLIARPIELLLGMIYYVFYVYADFGGYSLIAIGSALLLGVKVRPNFQQPFLSQTIPDFWRTWHMSLSFWVRDYLFVPMRIHWRARHWGFTAATILSFLIIGVWHGAGFGFILFGLIHGVLVTISYYTLARRNAFWASIGIPQPIVDMTRIPITFALVVLSFVVYRANSIHDAGTIYRKLFSKELFSDIIQRTGLPMLSNFHNLWLLTAVAIIALWDVSTQAKFGLEKWPGIIQVIIYNVGISLLVYKWTSGSAAQPFMYYRF